MQSLTSVRLLLANGEKFLPSRLGSPGPAALPSAGSPSHPREAKERGRASDLAVGRVPAPPASQTWVFLPGQVCLSRWREARRWLLLPGNAREGPGTLLRASLRRAQSRGIPHNGCRLKLVLKLCTPSPETTPTPQDKMEGPRRCPPSSNASQGFGWSKWGRPSLPWGHLRATEGRWGGCPSMVCGLKSSY